jgi:cell fate regulator YaaT (PSP1 superfamily)
MGCSSCSSGGGKPAGCGSKSGSCSSGGCNKLEVFDWLANMQTPTNQQPFDIVEVRFKNGRKGFFRNTKNLTLQVGDAIVVEGSPGHDVGVVSIVGELVRVQINKKVSNFKSHEARKIYRIATSEDLEKWKEARDAEQDTMHRARVMAIKHKLEMKISDVEYQGDLTKAVFFYTAESRVDFRLLIKDMADAFKIRIEMRQIGARQESARLGGIGSCGRELCCSTWLTDFRSVSTSSARYQQLSLNPQKLAGQCGKLKCCLNFELDSYLDAIKSFPSTELRLKTEHGHGVHIKTDVFKRTLWYAFNSTKTSAPGGLVPLSPERVKEIIAMNKEGKFPTDLKEYKAEVVAKVPDYANVDGQENLDRFDHKFKKKKKKKGGNSNQKSNQQVAKGKPNPKKKQAKPQGKNPNNKQGQPKKANPNAQNNEKANRNNPNYKPKGDKKGKPNQKKPVDASSKGNAPIAKTARPKNPNQKPKAPANKPKPQQKTASADKPKSNDETK